MKKLFWLIFPILLLMSCRSSVVKVKTSNFIEMCRKNDEKITNPYLYNVYEAIYPYCSYYKDSLSKDLHNKDSDYINFGLSFNWKDCVQEPFEYQEMAIIELYSVNPTKNQVFFVSYIYSPPSNWRDEKEKCKNITDGECKNVNCDVECKDECSGKCKKKCERKCERKCKRKCKKGSKEECKEECKEKCKEKCTDSDYYRYKCTVSLDQNGKCERKCKCKFKRKIKIKKTPKNEYKHAKPLDNDPVAKAALEAFLMEGSLHKKDSMMMIKDNVLIYSGYYLDGVTPFNESDTSTTRVLYLEQKFEYRKGKMKKSGKTSLILELKKETDSDTRLVCKQIVNYASNRLGGDKPVVFEMASILEIPAIVFREKIHFKKLEKPK